MKWINYLDEQQRFRGFVVGEGCGQEDSHGYSYLYTRQLYQDMGDIMGFDQLAELGFSMLAVEHCKNITPRDPMVALDSIDRLLLEERLLRQGEDDIA